MALDLRIPSERNAPTKDLELRPKQARAWLESLPLAQSVDAGRKILANLGAINRTKVEPDDRLQLLEAYAATAQVIFDELDAIYGKSLLPLPQKAREALVIARGLATEFGYGYKMLVLEKSGRKLLGFASKRQMPLLLYRAMQALARLLRTGYRSYSPIPVGTWQEIHRLYLHAESEDLAGEPADPETKASVLDLYAEALLVALTDPYRLVPGELDRIEQVIAGNTGAVTLGQARPDTMPGAHFLVPCDTDRPPRPLASASDDPGGPNWRLLDASPIVEKLRARRQAVQSGKVSAAMSKATGPEMLALIAKLTVLWGDPPKRNFRREAMETSVAICAGLKAIAHFVGLEPRAESREEAKAIARGITMPLVWVPDDDVSKGLGVREWEVVNQSVGGLKVRRDGALVQAITVGEVLGIKFMGKPHWTIGVVRWLTVLEESGMEFGIQFLAPAARPLTVKPTAASPMQSKPGLLLAEDDGFENANMVLTAPSTYTELRELDIEEEGLVSTMRATSLIERTGRFDLFHVAPS